MPASELPVALDAETLVQLWRQALAHQLDERVYSVPDGQSDSQAHSADHDAPVPPNRSAQRPPPTVVGTHNDHVPTSQPDERAQNIYSVPDSQLYFQAQHPVNTRGDHDAPIPPNQSAPPIVFSDREAPEQSTAPKTTAPDWVFKFKWPIVVARLNFSRKLKISNPSTSPASKQPQLKSSLTQAQIQSPSPDVRTRVGSCILGGQAVEDVEEITDMGHGEECKRVKCNSSSEILDLKQVKLSNIR
ncbi:hypothetical protein JOM56_014321 [Amanita muscaria]